MADTQLLEERLAQSPEEKAAKYREWRKKNPDYHREYKRRAYQKNRDKILAQNKEWRERNKLGLKAKARERLPQKRDHHREWRNRNREHVRARYREYVAKNRERIRALNRKFILGRYKLTLEDYERMLTQQEKRCAICKREANGKTLVVDHDHETGAVRALLCQSCNRGLGFMQDDPKLMIAGARYLRQWKQRQEEANGRHGAPAPGPAATSDAGDTSAAASNTAASATPGTSATTAREDRGREGSRALEA